MVRILLETSIPASTIQDLRARLAALAPASVRCHLEELGTEFSCAGLPAGGKASWVPCWISLVCEESAGAQLHAAVAELRSLVVDTARKGGATLHVVPASVQVGDEFHRLRDLRDVREILDRCS